jgi:hypothetical protein
MSQWFHAARKVGRYQSKRIDMGAPLTHPTIHVDTVHGPWSFARFQPTR